MKWFQFALSLAMVVSLASSAHAQQTSATNSLPGERTQLERGAVYTIAGVEDSRELSLYARVGPITSREFFDSMGGYCGFPDRLQARAFVRECWRKKRRGYRSSTARLGVSTYRIRSGVYGQPRCTSSSNLARRTDGRSFGRKLATSERLWKHFPSVGYLRRPSEARSVTLNGCLHTRSSRCRVPTSPNDGYDADGLTATRRTTGCTGARAAVTVLYPRGRCAGPVNQVLDGFTA